MSCLIAWRQPLVPIRDKYFFIFEWHKFVHLLVHEKWQITRVSLLEFFFLTFETLTANF